VFFAHFPPELRRAPEWAGVGELSGMDGDMHEKSEIGASVGASEVAGPSLPPCVGGSGRQVETRCRRPDPMAGRDPA
jgi:hypothetical protein